MRNLKRALSLALAAAMLISLMVVGASAKSYGDAASIDQTEAVEVLTGLGIVGGDQNGNFNPTATLTRAEFCVMIANALTGGKFDATLFEGTTTPFTDVNGHWGEAYIAYCYSSGIIAGTSATTFSPDATLTSAQAAAILLMALGYNQNSEFAQNGQFELNVTRWAQNAGLYTDLSVSANAGISRENTAKMIFNALTEVVPVAYSAAFDIYYNESGSWTAGVDYNWNDTLGYKNFDLVYKSNGVDDFGCPSILWGTGSINGGLGQDGKPVGANIAKDDEIVVVPDAAAYVFDGKMTGKALYDTVGKDVAETYKWNVEVDGDEQTVTVVGSSTVGYNELVTAKSSTAAFLSTGTSSHTEIFLDTTGKNVYVSVVNPYVAEVTRVRDNDDGTYDVVLNIKNAPAGVTDNTIEVETNDYAKDDVVVVTLAVDANDIKTIEAAQVVSGEITAVKSDNGFVRIDGAEYNVATKYYNLSASSTALPALTADVDAYLDTNGNLIAVDAQTVASDYLYVENSIKSLDGLNARVTLADGTSASINVVKVDNKDSGLDTSDLFKGNICTYTVDGDEYTLTKVNGTKDTNGTDGSITRGSATVTVDSSDTTSATATNKTVFVDVKNNTAYTGYNNVPSVTNATMKVVEKSNLAEIVFITEGIDTAADDYWFYVANATYVETKVDGATYREYTAYVDGVETTLTTKNMTAAASLTDEDSTLQANTIYKVKSTDSNGNITAFDKSNSFTAPLTYLNGNVNVAKDGVLALSSAAGDYSGASKTTFTYNDETVFVTIQAKAGGTTDTVELGSVSDIALVGNTDGDNESTVYVLSVEDTNDATPLATLVIIVNPV